MSRVRSNARRYAEAAFELADREGAIDAWRSALTTASERLASDEAQRVLANPAIPYRAREEVLRTALRGEVEGLPLNLVLLLLQRGRIERLPDVAREFRRLSDQREGIVQAQVSSAQELDDREVAAIRQRLGELTGGQVEMTFDVDPSLIGGVQVRLGDRLLDGSVRGRLERLRTRLAAGSL